MKQRIQSLLAEMNRGIYEKETEISLSLLAALAGESIILLGPPGVAKSMVARRLKEAFRGARSFEYLMSRFSTPDEIFGPVSISQLKSSDAYVRSTDGYLPTADVVFLDEIWKAGPAIQNTLLTVINEKLFRNGNVEMHLPLKLLVAASNELPAQGEGLEALWDRFIIRLECKNIKKESNFDKMLLATDDAAEADIDESLKITEKEYKEWTERIGEVEISADILETIHKIRRSIRAVAINGTNERRDVYVSDRRWKNIVRLLRTSAFMHDRNKVALSDIFPIYNCLWQEPEERDGIRSIIVGALFSKVKETLGKMQQDLKEDIRLHRAASAQKRVSSRQLKRDADKKLYNKFYYKLLGCSAENTYIFAQDYQQLPPYGKGAQQGVLYNDRRNPSVVVVRSYDGSMAAPIGSRPVALARDDRYVYIDGVRIEVEPIAEGDSMQLPFADVTDSGRDYSTEIEGIADYISDIENDMAENMFISEDDHKEIKVYLASLLKDIAFTRQDIEKLYD